MDENRKRKNIVWKDVKKKKFQKPNPYETNATFDASYYKSKYFVCVIKFFFKYLDIF